MGIVYAQENNTVRSVASLEWFVSKAIQLDVIPRQLVVSNYFGNPKFEEIDFRFKASMEWNISSECPDHKDIIVDATKGVGRSIKCYSNDQIIISGDGDDWIKNSDGNHIIYAGKGDDTINVGGGSSLVIFEKGWGHDKVTLNGVEVIPTATIGDDGAYRWRYSSFLIFGDGIEPEDVQWKDNSLVHVKTGDSITFNSNTNFNVVFMSKPKYKFQAQPKHIELMKQKVESLEVFKNILYILKGQSGLDIVDIKDVNRPLLLSHIDVPGRAMRSKREGNILYVAQSDQNQADNKGWISIIDVKNPLQPKLLSSVKYGGGVYDLLIKNNRLIILQSDHLIDRSIVHILDITQPQKPREVATSVLLKIHAQSIMMHDNLLWVASNYVSQIHRYDLKNIGSLLNAMEPIYIKNQFIYQMHSNPKVIIMRVSGSKGDEILVFENSHPFGKEMIYKIDKLENVQNNNSILFKDDYLFIAQGEKGVDVYDFTNPSAPVLKKTFDFDGRYIQSLVASGNKIFAVGGGGVNVKEIDGLFPKAVESGVKVTASTVLVPSKKEKVLSQEQLLKLLYDAISEDDGKKVNALIDQGAPFDTVTGSRYAPLKSAAGSGNNVALKVLLDRGANPNVNRGDAILSAACNKQDKSLRLLFQYGGDMKAKDNDGCTALHCVALDGTLETAKFLISKGANPFAMCRGKEIPLTWANYRKNQSMIDFFSGLEK